MTDTKEAHALAEKLYEASNTTGIPWNRRGRLVHDAWLATAIRQLAFPGVSNEPAPSAKTDMAALPTHAIAVNVERPDKTGIEPALKSSSEPGQRPAEHPAQTLEE
ncbi:hypothetical protein [Nitrospirillum sp. BR 11163]|uniref:hypothetical protein n=1 Tax=Nitrospirillum sp. BR 11163 TaxID=3104323 RepID=UPI002AFF9A01|nr:hypothetical protein [Nitrospirillum sp. BR 11163]MEA1671923.1 hypothetical protein [Nitrospirillum sp. BR 11163]